MQEREETRRLQFTGKSSYIVSLPKQWVTELGLKQGDQITITRQGKSGLKILPAKDQTKTVQSEEAVLEIARDDENSTIIRKLVSLYFLGYKTIQINQNRQIAARAEKCDQISSQRNVDGCGNYFRLS